MLYQFRKELIETLLKKHEVVLSMPFAGHEEDFQAMGCKCINTKIDRRGINPLKDLHLIKFYNKLLKEEKPDKVITYSIKPNIYAGLLCAWKKIPYYANVQGLGTAFQKPGLAQFVTLLYKAAFIKVQKVFFENKGNAGEFLKRRIVRKKENQSTQRRRSQPGALQLYRVPGDKCDPLPVFRKDHGGKGSQRTFLGNEEIEKRVRGQSDPGYCRIL